MDMNLLLKPNDVISLFDQLSHQIKDLSISINVTFFGQGGKVQIVGCLSIFYDNNFKLMCICCTLAGIKRNQNQLSPMIVEYLSPTDPGEYFMTQAPLT